MAIDISADVFDAVYRAVAAEHEGVFGSSEYVDMPPSLPAFSLVCVSDTYAQRTQDSSGRERYVTLLYEANAYSDKEQGASEEARAIIDCVCDAMLRLGFTRSYRNDAPNLNPAIKRHLARFSATVEESVDGVNHIYR